MCNTCTQSSLIKNIQDKIITPSPSAHGSSGSFEHVEGKGQCRKLEMLSRWKFNSLKRRQSPLIHHLQHITVQPDRPADSNGLIQTEQERNTLNANSTLACFCSIFILTCKTQSHTTDTLPFEAAFQSTSKMCVNAVMREGALH